MATRKHRCGTGEEERPDVDAMLEEVIAVCRKHGMSIAHEDCEGAFVIEREDEGNFAWLRCASVKFKEAKL